MIDATSNMPLLLTDFLSEISREELQLRCSLAKGKHFALSMQLSVLAAISSCSYQFLQVPQLRQCSSPYTRTASQEPRLVGCLVVHTGRYKRRHSAALIPGDLLRYQSPFNISFTQGRQFSNAHRAW